MYIKINKYSGEALTMSNDPYSFIGEDEEVIHDSNFVKVKGKVAYYIDGILSYVDKVELPHTYDENRATEYPPLEDQLDMLYHAMDAGEIPKATQWYNTIRTIKDNNPKG